MWEPQATTLGNQQRFQVPETGPGTEKGEPGKKKAQEVEKGIREPKTGSPIIALGQI